MSAQTNQSKLYKVSNCELTARPGPDPNSIRPLQNNPAQKITQSCLFYEKEETIKCCPFGDSGYAYHKKGTILVLLFVTVVTTS